jgi:YesN/AraC family two-component response regulator
MAERKFSFVVAEDEKRVRDYLARKTCELGPSFVCAGTAADGEEAMALVRRCIPDLLITDIRMPVLGGLELIERIRGENPDLRIVIVSGYSEFEYARRAIELGVDDYILKPVDAEKLREVLRRIKIRLESSAGSVENEFGLDKATAREADVAKAIRVYLQENLRQPYSSRKLSAAFGGKTAYILRLYRRATGSTPTQDLKRFRIEKAKRLLVGHPELEIKQVAAAVGFKDPLYFSRLFKEETGSSPSAFRESTGRS